MRVGLTLLYICFKLMYMFNAFITVYWCCVPSYKSLLLRKLFGINFGLDLDDLGWPQLLLLLLLYSYYFF